VVALGGDASGYGALGMAIVAGQLLGSLLRSARSWGRPLAALVGGTVALGAGLAGIAVAPGLGAALAGAALVGLAAAVLNVELQTLMQTRVDPDRLGRSLGVFTALSRAAQPAGFALAGAVAGAVGPRDVFAVMGIVTVAMSLLWLRPSVAARLARN
jgi:DHA3 family macrolide efflux protein-like MFS transporter